MNSKQQKVVIDINDDFTFTGDHDTTLVIFRNLLSNAFKYSGESETITISQKNNEISISNICSKTTESGSGIGLIICKDLAVQNDYKLDFKINNDKAIVNLKV
jgi:signal transduction histidine kinase